MGYSVKWVNDNLGITRDMLRYYEKEKLLPKNKNNKYRSYNDEDISRIWGIKLLMGIGFTAKEVFSFMHNPDFDFDEAITNKVEELEKSYDEKLTQLQFAKSIKLSGRIPNVSKFGSMKFDEFLKCARENWNFYQNPHTAPFMEALDILILNKPQEKSSKDESSILNAFEDFEKMSFSYGLHAYYQVLSEMRDLDYKNKIVQRVVRLIHQFTIDINNDSNILPYLSEEITPQIFAKHFTSQFVLGDIAVLFQRNYGEEGCCFMAKAFAYYGGINIEDFL
ncbi:MerR family transcriptional regulator [Enterococcus cecorum]|uniref:MerR family transcriptional regulator n=1 Tax=Enterococcus cecorum TaxID=44008 RepID=UPI000A5C5A7F|nr:MerR family transcriptional regulator [Enterococcus cecorum]MBM6935378.1 MerR family transcriptional regulator [Enterococcus cecorum]MCJ0535302.1 MerR family transcriptional regulator [Enterococcus cecorum]MCJ0555052.1 MerR family transcriptional regulator [Enterococcus cecorum]MCJ0579455.1 MerR family transcriptional regulator [Enterococcus cecorum]CAI3261116.1 MerR family transcriptional regulator [Enterococcus cecorum]